MASAYLEDLAYVHDQGFGDTARAAAGFLLGRLRAVGHRGGLVVDLGCGSGILAEALTAAGYRVLGIDWSPAMIELARRRAPAAEFRVGSLLDVEPPACVAVTAVGECLNYLFDQGHSEKALHKLSRRIYDALEPGGLFVCDVAGPGRVPRPNPRRSFVEGDDWAVLVETAGDGRRRRLTRRIVTFRRLGEGYRRSEEVHRLRLLEPRPLAGWLRAAGFRVRTLTSYGRRPLLPGVFGVAARKPGPG